MSENKDKLMLTHNITLKDRKLLTVSGVTDVDSFDDVEIVAYTDAGELTVRGEQLKINRLNTETGELNVEGVISSLSYLNERPEAKSFLARIFR
ncbi:MAG: sporulation protein YabP [Clostridia bacterium]|nr:sporulation protein YabP [Clostridia bacterium]